MKNLKTGDKMTIEAARKRWEERCKKFSERKDEFKTSSGIEVPRLALSHSERSDGCDPELASDYEASLGFPGEYPFTRGVQPTMYRGRFWTMRQYAGYASA